MAVADKSSTIADDVGDGGDVGDGDDVGDGGDIGDFCLVWLDTCVCRGTMAAPHLKSKMICLDMARYVPIFFKMKKICV